MIRRIAKTDSITFFIFIILFSALFILSNPLDLQAQAEGTITGKVVETTTGSVLPGANIVIEGTNRGAAADPSGRFTISDLPAGSYTLTASFLGYQDMAKEIEVIANQTVTLDFSLQEGVLTGETVEVYGELTRGQAKALQKQKMAQNIVQVVDEEFFGRFPDRNAAETVRRLPSISVSRDQGEGEFVQIRGMGEEYNAVTLNGIRIPAPDENEGVRSVGLDLINNRLLGQIEVTKAITPEMDGDAIGGVVNFGLRKAPDEGIAVLGLGAGYNDQVSDFDKWGRGILDGYALWGQRFLDNKLGLLIDAAYYKTNRHSILKELAYANEGEGPYSNEIVEQHTNDYDIQRRRYGVSLSGDYEFNPLHRIYLTYNRNTYLDDEIRREDSYYISDNEEERQTRNRVEDQRLNLAMFGGEHNLGWFKLDYKGAWIKATEALPDRTYIRYGRDLDFSSYSNSERINFDGTSKFPGADPITLNRVRYDNDLKSDKDLSGQINVTIPFRFMGGDRSSVKFGTKILRKSVSFDHHRFQISGSSRFTEAVTTPEGTFGFEDVRYKNASLSKYFAVAPTENNDKTDSYDASEDITSLYGMTQLNFTPEFSVLAGIRFEDTKTDYTQPWWLDEAGNLVSDNPREGTGGYNNILPSIHFMYRFDNSNNLKLAYSTGLARPRYQELVPRMVVSVPSSNSSLDGRINYGNPDLEPRTAYNFDLMYDRFTPYLGLISVGLFYKKFKAWQITRTFTEQYDFVNDAGEETPDGILETYQASQSIMGDGTATYFGVELNVQQRLNSLSDLLKWFAVNLNFTYTYSKGEIEGRDVVMTRSPKYIANGSVIYDNTNLGLSVVVAANYRDPILGGLEVDDYGRNKYLDTWFDSEFALDISVAQKITDKLMIIGQVNGMGNTQERETRGDPRESWSRTQQQEKYGPYGTLGVQYNFW